MSRQKTFNKTQRLPITEQDSQPKFKSMHKEYPDKSI